MDLVLKSDRLTLRPFEPADVDICIELFTDPDVTHYAGDVQKREDIEVAMPTWVRRGSNGCIGIWCIEATATGEKLGTVALLPLPIDEKETNWDLLIPGEMPDADIEVGYYIKRSAWGNGYATEACKRIVAFAFEHSPLTEVVATFDRKNLASRNVLLKAGFVDLGMRHCYGEEGHDFRIRKT